MTPKFRAWDKKLSVMAKVISLSFYDEKSVYRNDETESYLFYPSLNSFNLRPFKDIELMQSTGLKDKNEVEIFEGDIVRCTVDNWSNGEKFEQIDKVVYEDCMFTFSDGYKYDCSIAETTYLSKEVIGNIYENSDLLEAE
ncbi:hypothetical protein [Enterococcus phage phiSHEF13]|uniref:YopX protein domain-containing protein n=1 Tax=Enterococcus phage phiSHEF13 TaxID=2918648 RepID=A0AAE9FKV7_9CAUD|nr:hypothetical protein [Enterococcus phage phiSHEF13]